MGTWDGSNLFRGSTGQDPPTSLSALWPQVHNPVGRLDDILLALVGWSLFSGQ